MNLSTLLGILAGASVLALSFVLAVDEGWIFVNLPGLLLVVGGTIAATLLSYPFSEVRRAVRASLAVLRSDQGYRDEDIDEIVRVARLWFQGDLHAVEREMARIRSPFLKTGLQLVIEGTALPDILELLRWRIARLKTRELAEARLFRTMAAFAPAFGMTGTLLGLVDMLATMDGGDAQRIGADMAVALVTTFYGVLLANLAFKPVAVKLERRVEQRVAILGMVLEGVALISERRSPTYVRETLRSFAAHHDDEVGRVAPDRAADRRVDAGPP